MDPYTLGAVLASCGSVTLCFVAAGFWTLLARDSRRNR